MDRLTALVSIAHLRLRLNIVEKYPHLLEGLEMTPKLAGVAEALAKLQHGLEARSEKLMARIAGAETKADETFNKSHKTLDKADDAMSAVDSFLSKLEGANGGPLLDSSDSSEDTVEHLTVNGVSAP